MRRSGEKADRAERAPIGLAALAAALAVSVSPAALAQTQTAGPVSPPAAQNPEAVLLEADVLINDQQAGTVTAEGDVQVRYQGRTMRADRLIYDLNGGSIRAVGNVEIVLEDGSVTYADAIDADDALNVGAASELRARLGQTGTLAARQALRHGEGESELRNVIYTSCPVCETGDRPPTWSLRARRAVQDRESRTISYYGAVVEVAGVPVLYLPYIAHPDPTIERASGFLPPEIGRNRRLGTFYGQPYYWAISPSQDLTASLRVHGNVNPLIGLDYRKRFWSGEIELDTTFTQERLFDNDGDRLGEDRFRYSAFAEGRFDISEQWQWGFGIERIYDDEYLRRYDISGAGERRGPYIGHDTRLISQLFAIGQSAHSYTSITAAGFQDFREVPNPADRVTQPVILPFAESEYVMNDAVFGGQMRFQTNTAVLLRNDNPDTLELEGNDGRFSLGATWRRDMIFGPGIVVSPMAHVRGDVFGVETAVDNYESFGRALGMGGVEISWPFMRPGERFDLIFEPVVVAAYGSEDADDPRIVNEDSLAFELDDSNLFRPSAAPNYDLWEPGGRVSAGVRATARARTGESASLIFGRRWREEAAVGFTPASNLNGESSDWVAAVQTDLGSGFGTEARFRLDDETFEIQRVDLALRATAGRFSGAVRYFSIDEDLLTDPEDPSEEISARVGVELARGWRMQLAVTSDLDSDINLSQDIRAIYEDDCTFLEIAYTRTETRRGTIGPDEGIQIRVGLRSLGVFGGS